MLNNTFKFFDLAKTGLCNRDQWKKVIVKLGISKFSEEDLSFLFYLYDTDNQGLIQYKNFIYDLLSFSSSQINNNSIPVTGNSYNNNNNNNNNSVSQSFPQNKIKIEAEDVLTKLRAKLAIRGIKTILSINKAFKIMDSNNQGLIDINDFQKGLKDYGVDLNSSDASSLFKFFDREDSGSIDYQTFINHIRGKMNPHRRNLVEGAFMNCSKGNSSVSLEEIKGEFNVLGHPDVNKGVKTPEEVHFQFVNSFDLFHIVYHFVNSESNNESNNENIRFVNKDEFVEYYEYVSMTVEEDNYFASMISNCWNLNLNLNLRIKGKGTNGNSALPTQIQGTGNINSRIGTYNKSQEEKEKEKIETEKIENYLNEAMASGTGGNSNRINQSNFKEDNFGYMSKNNIIHDRNINVNPITNNLSSSSHNNINNNKIRNSSNISNSSNVSNKRIQDKEKEKDRNNFSIENPIQNPHHNSNNSPIINNPNSLIYNPIYNPKYYPIPNHTHNPIYNNSNIVNSLISPTSNANANLNSNAYANEISKSNPSIRYTSPLESVKKFKIKLAARGIKGIHSLKRIFNLSDANKTGKANIIQLSNFISDYRMSLTEEEIEDIFTVFDRRGTGELNYQEFLKSIVGEVNETRKSVLRRVFTKLDPNESGKVPISEIKALYNEIRHPDVISGKRSEDEVLAEWLDNIDQFFNHKGRLGVDVVISLEQFVEFYGEISMSIGDDRYFDLMLNNCWGLDGHGRRHFVSSMHGQNGRNVIGLNKY